MENRDSDTREAGPTAPEAARQAAPRRGCGCDHDCDPEDCPPGCPCTPCC
jgi:hypothetical protein